MIKRRSLDSAISFRSAYQSNAILFVPHLRFLFLTSSFLLLLLIFLSRSFYCFRWYFLLHSSFSSSSCPISSDPALSPIPPPPWCRSLFLLILLHLRCIFFLLFNRSIFPCLHHFSVLFDQPPLPILLLLL